MKTRITTGVIAGALFIPFIWYGGVPFTGLIYVLATIGLYELMKMKQIHTYSVPAVFSIVLLWVILLPSKYAEILEGMGILKTELMFIIVLLLLSYTVLMKNKF